VRVHELPDYVYFEHRAHVNAGVGCVSCHGHIEEEDVVHQAEPLSMGWCLDCHRNPRPYLRPRAEVTNMKWVPPRDPAARARLASSLPAVRPPTDCSGCHR
jgi:menaquinone reductase, multiheme cytochrome c subunit